MKKQIAAKIKAYIQNGGFLFAMCSATDSFDIALAAQNVDIVSAVYDETQVHPNYRNKMDFSNSVAFEEHNLQRSFAT